MGFYTQEETQMDIDSELEKLVDQHGIEFLVDKLAEICDAKAAHIRESYQDENLAQRWEEKANYLEATFYELEGV
jgi:hypothetical protein